MQNEATKKKKVEFPHIIILLTLMVFVACALTYILPAGIYDVNPETNTIDPNSFHYVENTPVSPLKAILSFQSNLAGGSLVISLLLILGAATEVLVSSKAVESLVDTGIAKFKDKSIPVVIPTIYVLMSVLGALSGNDSMIAYVAIGLLIAKRLKLDRIAAVSMFYLPYITGQAAGPTTSIVLVAQGMLDIEPLSGASIRLIIWTIFTIIGATYTTRYALKINADPEKSLLKVEDRFTNCSDEDYDEKTKEGKFELKAFMSVLTVILSYVLYAYGAKNWQWSWNHLTTCILVSSILIGVFHRQSPNTIAKTLFQGAAKMGGICFLIGVARTIAATLTAGNVIHTIAHSTIGLFDGMSAAVCAIGLFVFNLLFNFLVPSGTTQAAIILPITTPIGDVIGITRQVMSFVLQLGDGLTNCVTPLSAPLMGALTIAGVQYTKWIKYVVRVVLTNILVAAIAIFLLQTLQWV